MSILGPSSLKGESFMKLSSLFGSIALVAALGGMALAQDKSGLKDWAGEYVSAQTFWTLSLIHISEPTRRTQ